MAGQTVRGGEDGAVGARMVLWGQGWADGPGGRASWGGAGLGLSTPHFIRHLLPPFSVQGCLFPCWPPSRALGLLHRPAYHGSLQPESLSENSSEAPLQPASPGLVPNSQEGEDDPFTVGLCPGLAQPAVARRAGPALTSDSPPQAALDGKGLERTTCISPGRSHGPAELPASVSCL